MADPDAVPSSGLALPVVHLGSEPVDRTPVSPSCDCHFVIQIINLKNELVL